MEIAGRKIGAGLIIGVILGIIVLWGIIWYNGTVSANEDVKGQWGKVESAYQRRADLIPNLVNTVKGYAKHESDVLIQVTQARASVGQVKIDPSNMKAEDIQKFIRLMPVNFDILLDKDGTAVRDWKVYAYPSNYLIDKTGLIQYAYRGALEWDSAPVIQTIEKLL